MVEQHHHTLVQERQMVDDICATESKDVNQMEDTALRKQNAQRFRGQQVVWSNAILIAILQVSALYYAITFPYFTRFKTAFLFWFIAWLASIGITAGAHRLWTHRAYKAKTPLRIILLILYCTAGQYSLYTWIRDHRTHHKYTETDADPHNSTRGFFFSHMGWFMLKRHPEVKRKGKLIDMSDILADPVAAFGEKYFMQLKILFCFVIPILIPVYGWNEDWYYAFVSQWIMRYALTLNGTWTVNSLAHMFGSKPYDKNIAPTEIAVVSYVTGGEGWHNYHHTFPWDYKAAEIPNVYLDMSTHFIHVFAAIGWAYDLKTPSPDLIRRTALRKGDGSRHFEVPPPFK